MAAGAFGGDAFNNRKAWITEANPGDWPDGACVDILNMEITQKGEVYRRLGIIKEQLGGNLVLGGKSEGVVFAAFMWKDAGGQAGNDVLVIQRGLTLAMYGNSYPLSAYYIGVVQLAPVVSDANPLGHVASLVSVNGDAVVAHPLCDPTRISLSADGVLSSASISLQVRVLETISTVPPEQRLTGLTADVEFDLRNGGWPFSTTITKDEKGTGAITGDPLQVTLDKVGKYPAIADLFYSLKTSSAEEASALGTYSPWELGKVVASTGNPASGRFITSAFSIDVGTLLAQYALREQTAPLTGSGGTSRTTSKRPTAVGLLNGRIVYAGEDYNKTSCLFYSSLPTDSKMYGRCYQEADPTAEEINDLVATDGGVIRAPGMGTVLRMEELSGALLLFTTTGVWAMSGSGDSVGFDATSFMVSKLSNEECLSPRSVVEMAGTVLFFGITGIHAVAADQTGGLRVSNISLTTIQSFYDQLSYAVKEGAVGVADSNLGRVEWSMYTNDDSEYYTLLLVFDARLGGFVKHRVPAGVQSIILPLPPYTATSSGAGAVQTLQVVTPTQDVVTSTGDSVGFQLSSLTTSSPAARRFRYLVGDTGTGLATVGEMLSTTFKDWYGMSPSPVDAAGYIEFPYIYNSLGQGATKRAARASAQYINAFTLRGRLL